jgi:hypothetical protein
MTLKPGSQLGPYEIVEPIGAGGMGEVYPGKTFKNKMSLFKGKDQIDLYYFGPGHTRRCLGCFQSDPGKAGIQSIALFRIQSLFRFESKMIGLPCRLNEV